jgi:hypothetical protein
MIPKPDSIADPTTSGQLMKSTTPWHINLIEEAIAARYHESYPKICPGKYAEYYNGATGRVWWSSKIGYGFMIHFREIPFPLITSRTECNHGFFE